MKKTLFVFLLPLAILCAADRKPGSEAQQNGNTAGTNPKAQEYARRNAPKPAAGNHELQLPKDAKKIEPFAWAWTDPNGKKWIYRQTPFGLVRSEDKPEARPAAEGKMPVTFTDQGDSIRFDRKSPWGVTTWTKKKTELNEDEKKIVADGQSQGQAEPGDKK